ncbi:MAG: TetR/AcrR family transcriptional regulator [Desulfatirhabdiaceae bacterium]
MNDTAPAEPLSRSAQRRQREREQRYQTILRASETLFASEGYHKTSMERIADSAEVSVGTVYFYFKNKEDLLIQLLDEIGFELRNLLGTEFRKADVKLDGFKRAGEIFFEEFCQKYPERIVIIYRESVGQSPLVEEHRKHIFDRLIADVQSALIRLSENNRITFASDLSAEVMAVSIMGMFERLAYHYMIWQDRKGDLKTIGRDAVDFILGGIRNLSRT